MISLVLADDHHVVRDGLRVLLESRGGFQILGEAEDGVRAVELVEKLCPDAIVLDLMMPRRNGLEVTRHLSRTVPSTSIVILSMYLDEAYVLEAMRAGARAYVLKSATSDELINAIHEAIGGRRYLSPPLSERAIQVYLSAAHQTVIEDGEALTQREREVLQLAAEGRTTGEIAEALSISKRTAQTHRANLMQKLDLHSQTDLVRYAMNRGILREHPAKPALP